MKPTDARYKKPVFKKHKNIEFCYISWYIWGKIEPEQNLLINKKKLNYYKIVQLRLFK